jgi:hypothetical protein
MRSCHPWQLLAQSCVPAAGTRDVLGNLAAQCEHGLAVSSVKATRPSGRAACQ